MSDLTDFLHKLVDAVARPSDHSTADLHAEVDALGGGDPAQEDAPSEPEDVPSEPDTPAANFQAPSPDGDD